MTAVSHSDVAVVGGGAAGLFVALRAAEAGASVTLVSRKPLSESASYRAQGGLAAALAPDDSPERHAADTLAAGRGLCRRSAVDALVRKAPSAVAELRRRGVEFDLDPAAAPPGAGDRALAPPASDAAQPDDAPPSARDSERAPLALGLEGGHSARRIVHAGGSETGRAITARLAELVGSEPNVRVLEGTSVTALWSDGERCAGVITDDGAVAAAATVLATGGGAALWRRTTNPWGAIGAGAVLAHAAGADLADLELCQFHPTALVVPGGEHDGSLITEAVRGEGARLLDASGRRFTDELGPRDQVSAAILDRMEADSADRVFLDLRHIDRARFATVLAVCRAAGLDPVREPVPVAPAAHYLIGGVACDLDGRTSLPGLLAVGECSCSGLHGANRLASNSLSECFVFGARVAAAVERETPGEKIAMPSWRFEPPTAETRDAVWQHAGPRRDADSIAPLLEDPYPLARLIGRAALERRESRGAHRRADFPLPDPALDGVHLVVGGGEEVRPERWD